MPPPPGPDASPSNVIDLDHPQHDHNHQSDPPHDLHFRNAFVSPPPPPPHLSSTSNFLDNILNHDIQLHPPLHYLPVPSVLHQPPPVQVNMAPDPRPRPARLPNGYVDLTGGADSPPPARRKRTSPTPGPSAKRQKRAQGGSSQRESSASAAVEEVDLTEDNTPVQNVLQKQREDAVKAQTRPEEKATTFNTFTCVICMDSPTDLSATACGHLFCHTCLMEALIAGENRTGPGETKRSQCPVCRKIINRNKTADVIPLSLKKGLATQPRRKAAKAE